MRHFQHIDPDERARLFHRAPVAFDRDSHPATLAVALGATLYSPGTRPDLGADIAKQSARGVTSMVLCLEDAIGDGDVEAAETNVVTQLRRYADSGRDGPLLFVRVREPEQILSIAVRLGEAGSVLSGFVLPKFTEESGSAFLDAVADAAAATGRRLLAMPVLESPEIMHLETRRPVLLAARDVLDKYRHLVLAIRIGATDLCAAYGLRRSRDLTAYDVPLVAGVIADIVNVFGRADESGFVVTGPVWEYFPNRERMFKPQLRRTPFDQHEPEASRLRSKLIDADLDGLIREVELDKHNGLLGKTAIHPSHVAAIHALSVVTHEEYSDARDILVCAGAGGGVLRSAYTNKMNEAKPHQAWARTVMRRAEAFGVAREGMSFVDLLGTGVCA